MVTARFLANLLPIDVIYCRLITVLKPSTSEPMESNALNKCKLPGDMHIKMIMIPTRRNVKVVN